MSDTTQATFMADGSTDTENTIDDAGLLAKVRDTDHPAVRCGYCQEVAVAGYKRSAHARRYCPHCDTVKAEDQRDRANRGWWEK